MGRLKLKKKKKEKSYGVLFFFFFQFIFLFIIQFVKSPFGDAVWRCYLAMLRALIAALFFVNAELVSI